jgi:hypothetical protein
MKQKEINNESLRKQRKTSKGGFHLSEKLSVSVKVEQKEIWETETKKKKTNSFRTWPLTT